MGHPLIVALGKKGSGKTTFLNYIFNTMNTKKKALLPFQSGEKEDYMVQAYDIEKFDTSFTFVEAAGLLDTNLSRDESIICALNYEKRVGVAMPMPVLVISASQWKNGAEVEGSLDFLKKLFSYREHGNLTTVMTQLNLLPEKEKATVYEDFKSRFPKMCIEKNIATGLIFRFNNEIDKDFEEFTAYAVSYTHLTLPTILRV